LKILHDEKKCVRCGICASESENGGIKFQRGKIFIDETKNEDWHAIAAICPVAALAIKNFISNV